MRWVSCLKKTGVTRLDLLLVGAHFASVDLVSDLFEVALGFGLLILQLGQLDIPIARMLPTVPLLISIFRLIQLARRFGQLFKELFSVVPLDGAFRLLVDPGDGD